MPRRLDRRFDVGYVPSGSPAWLPDLGHWAAAAARCLTVGARLYVTDFMTGPGTGLPALPGPASKAPGGAHPWAHSPGEVRAAVAGAGPRPEFLHAFPGCRPPLFFLRATAA